MEIVNGLWIEGSLSRMEQMSILSFLAAGHSYRLWTYRDVSGVPPGAQVANAADIIAPGEVFRYKCFPRKAKCGFQGFSDLFRYKLLFEDGGWWADLDVTLLQRLPSAEYSMAHHYEIGLVGNVMRFPKGHRVLGEAYERGRREVTESNTSWLKPVTILTSLIDQYVGIENVTRTCFGGDDPMVIKKLAGAPLEPIPKEWHGIHWCRTNWSKWKLDFDCPVRGSTYAALMDRFIIPMMSPNAEN